MQNTSYEIILYVKDQASSRDFYSATLGKMPELDAPGMTEFMLDERLKLGLMSESGIRKILADHTPDPASGNGIPRCELYILSEKSVDLFDRALASGAKLISKFEDRDWGHRVAYVSDPDGHVLAFATGPQAVS